MQEIVLLGAVCHRVSPEINSSLSLFFPFPPSSSRFPLSCHPRAAVISGTDRAREDTMRIARRDPLRVKQQQKHENRRTSFLPPNDPSPDSLLASRSLSPFLLPLITFVVQEHN